MAAGSTVVGKSGVHDVDALVVGTKWDTLELSYSFFASGDFGAAPPEGFQPLAARERLLSESIFRHVSSFTNLKFAEASTSSGGDIRFGSAKMDVGGYAGYPGAGEGGDVWINVDSIQWGFTQPGDVLGYIFLHEVGHALGLKHGHEFPALKPEHNGHEFSLMTYGSYIGQPQELMYAPREENGGYPQTFMMYDIAALQHMYGANYGYNAGDTVYRWDPGTGQMSIDGVGQSTPWTNRIFMTLWDGGGTDTYDLSNYAGGVKVDLAPGGWSTFSKSQLVDLNYQGWDVPPTYARGNVANALLHRGDTRSLIENAIGGAGNDELKGNVGANALNGGNGNDLLYGREGDDRLEGGAGDDFLDGGLGLDLASYATAGAAVTVKLGIAGPQDTGSAGKDTLVAIEGAIGSAFADFLTGSGGVNLLRGGGGDDDLSGGGGDDLLQGDAGADRLDGGSGFDMAGYASAVAAVTLDLRLAGPQQTGGGGLDTLVSIEGAAGSAYADRLTGTDAANRLDGAGGADILTGLGGNDIYLVDRPGDKAVEASGGGVDTVRSSVDWVLGANLENLVLTGAALAGTGNALANRLVGNEAANLLKGAAGDDVLEGGAGDDRLDGGTGADRMSGGLGNDIYVVDSAGDRTYEAAGAGEDGVRSNIAWTLAANVEHLTLTGTAAVNGAGNGLANSLTGNKAANVLSGMAGDDRLEGGLGNDRLKGGDGIDTAVYASAAAGVAVDLAVAAAQNTGAAGWDTLLDIENVVGSAFGDRLAGGAGANLIDGGAGDDLLFGGDGNDRLLGGAGADRMEGGTGNDAYIVDDVGDRAVEVAGGGVDTVYAAVSFTLGANVEKLVLTGGRAVNGSGNALANTLTGNGGANILRGLDGNDTLDGAGGADRLAGGIGDDVYHVDNAGDAIVEAAGAGYDIVVASTNYTLAEGAEIERLTVGKTRFGITLTGNSGDNLILGGAAGDSLYGAGGDDVLIGGGGSDLFVGGEGADIFRFKPGAIADVPYAADRIGDFTSGVDRIDLSAIDADAGTAGDQAFTFIGDAAFSGSAGQLRAFAGEGGVILSSSFIWVEGDTDGDGRADFYIILHGGDAPLAADFVL